MRRKKKTALSIGIIVDPIGVGVGDCWTSPEEEVKEIKRQFTRHLDSYRLNFYDSGLEDLIIKQLDIFVVDYGGLLLGATELLGSVMRAVRKYSEEHPSCTLILWSKTTRECYTETEYTEEGVIGDSFEGEEDMLTYGGGCSSIEKFWEKVKEIFPE